jgi:hypothetical protein
MEPVHLFLFTDGAFSEKVALTKTPGTGGDMIQDPFRWDHRISVFLIEDPFQISSGARFDELCALSMVTTCNKL